MYAGSAGLFAERSWMKCKESFVSQMFSDQCTPVRGIAVQPSTAPADTSGSAASQPSSSGDTPRMVPAPSDGVEKVDRGN
jgi:hypothetical protein